MRATSSIYSMRTDANQPLRLVLPALSSLPDPACRNRVHTTHTAELLSASVCSRMALVRGSLRQACARATLSSPITTIGGCR